MSNFDELVRATRSYRRFHEERAISRETLEELVDLARLSPSAANLQPLKYMLSYDPARNAAIFPMLAWAGYLKGWAGPAEGERPAAYIIVLGDKRLSRDFGVDHGIAAQTIVLGAAERGIGACMVGSVKRDMLRHELRIPPDLDILLVVSLGYPAETVVIEAVGADGSIRYWRDADDVHHVPKRPLGDLIVG